MTAQLYCFGESGNAYKCALALTLPDVEWEPVFVDFFKGEARSPNEAFTASIRSCVATYWSEPWNFILWGGQASLDGFESV